MISSRGKDENLNNGEEIMSNAQESNDQFSDDQKKLQEFFDKINLLIKSKNINGLYTIIMSHPELLLIEAQSVTLYTHLIKSLPTQVGISIQLL